MKKNIVFGILGTLGMVNGAQATEWKTFDPNNSTLFKVSVYNSGAACTPYRGTIGNDSFRTDVLVTYGGDHSRLSDFTSYVYECAPNWLDDLNNPNITHSTKTCTNGTKVAAVGYADAQRYKEALEFNIVGEGNNKVWRCNDSGFNEWEYAGKTMSDCQRAAYTKFKNKTNAVPVLVSPSTDDQTFSYTYVNPPNDICIAYVCNPEISIATMNPFTSSTREMQNSQYECMPINSQCSMMYGERQIKMPTGYQYVGKLGSSFRDKAAFPALKAKMDQTVQENQALVTELYQKVSASHSVFEQKSDSTGTYISIKDNVLDTLNFYIRCETGGLVFAPATCPTYFKLQNTECVLDTNGIRTAIDTKNTADREAAQEAAQTTRNSATKECARKFCVASGGQYMSSNGTCTCGGELCNDSHRGYYYCKPSLRKHCVGGVWTGWGNRVPTPESIDIDAAGWRFDLDACIANANNAYNASINGSSTNTTDTTASISDLAGRLALVEDQFGLSKWRTADGKFNTARLASDLTAGVVLGTTGALVTSSVVKKKQVKDGFESLECTVGGQHVGDWGDVFRIDGK